MRGLQQTDVTKHTEYIYEYTQSKYAPRSNKGNSPKSNNELKDSVDILSLHFQLSNSHS